MAIDATGPWRRLDPATAAVRIDDDGEPATTLPVVYHARRLRISWSDEDGAEDVLSLLREVLADTGYEAVVIPTIAEASDEADRSVRGADPSQQGVDRKDGGGVRPEQLLELLPDELREEIVGLLQTTVEFVPTGEVAGPPPDPWEVLLQLQGLEPATARRIDLDHLVVPADLVAAPYWASPYWASPYWASPYWASPYWASASGGASPAADYTRPGFGGRSPVHLPVADPRETDERSVDGGTARRPVVAILDSGLGTHPWFPTTIPATVSVGGTTLLIGGPDADSDPTPPDPRTGTLAATQGHGTFIAGIVRQTAPYADILPASVIDHLGTATDSDVHAALLLLLVRHRLAMLDPRRASRPETGPIDVVSISLGSYHQEPTGPAAVAGLQPVLAALVAQGVTIVTAMGNDAVDRRFYPAGYADDPAMSDSDGTGALLAVGALNPSHQSVAMFSNDGSWKSHERCGAAIVSTMPTNLRGSLQALAATSDGSARATIDVDDFSGGFAVWSGTSFAAPVIAGEVAASLPDHAARAVSREGFTKRRARSLATVAPRPTRDAS